jgi:hypothetical protein
MHVIALLFAIGAFVAFGIDYARSKSLIAIGLALLTVAWVLALLLETADPVVVHL